jgi:hypothetical protein
MEGVAGNQTPSANSEIIHPSLLHAPSAPCVVNFLEGYGFAVSTEWQFKGESEIQPNVD